MKTKPLKLCERASVCKKYQFTVIIIITIIKSQLQMQSTSWPCALNDFQFHFRLKLSIEWKSSVNEWRWRCCCCCRSKWMGFSFNPLKCIAALKYHLLVCVCVYAEYQSLGFVIEILSSQYQYKYIIIIADTFSYLAVCRACAETDASKNEYGIL